MDVRVFDKSKPSGCHVTETRGRMRQGCCIEAIGHSAEEMHALFSGAVPSSTDVAACLGVQLGRFVTQGVGRSKRGPGAEVVCYAAI